MWYSRHPTMHIADWVESNCDGNVEIIYLDGIATYLGLIILSLSFITKMATTSKQKLPSSFYEETSNDNNKIELFPLPESQEGDITAFNTISPSNVVPLRKLKQWPRAIICPA